LPIRQNLINGDLFSKTPFARALVVPVHAPPARICSLLMSHQVQVIEKQLIVYNLNFKNKIAGKVGNELPYNDCQAIFETGKVHLVYRLGLKGFKFHYVSVAEKYGRHLPGHVMFKPSLSNFTAYPNGCIYRVETQLNQRVVSKAQYHPHSQDCKIDLWQGHLGLGLDSRGFCYATWHSDTELLSLPKDFVVKDINIWNSPACEFLATVASHAILPHWKLRIPRRFRRDPSEETQEERPYQAITEVGFLPHNYPEPAPVPDSTPAPDTSTAPAEPSIDLGDLLQRTLYDDLDDLHNYQGMFLDNGAQEDALQPEPLDWLLAGENDARTNTEK